MSGRYSFTLKDINNSTGASPILNVIAASERRTWQGEHTLTLRVPVFDHLRIPVSTYDGEHASVYGISSFQEKKYIAKIDTEGSNNETFIIQSVATIRQGTDLFYEIVAEQQWTVALLDRRVDIQGDFTGIDALTLLNKVRDTFTASPTNLTQSDTDIPTTEYRSFTLSYPTALELLNLIVKEFSGATVYYWGVSGSTVFIYSEGHAAWTTHDSPISYRSNLLGITRHSDAHKLANTILGAGNDGILNLMMSGSSRYCIDVAGTDITAQAGTATITMNDGGGDTNPIMVNSDIFVEVNHTVVYNSTGTVTWGLRFELLGAADAVRATLEEVIEYTLSANSDNDYRFVLRIDKNFSDVVKIKMTVTSDASSPFASSWTFSMDKVGHTNAANGITVVNSASVTKYGTVEDVVRIARPSIYNLHNDSESIGLNSTFSGTYTGGLQAGLTKISIPSVTENTNKDFIESGTASQKVVTAAIGQGVTFNADPFLAGLPLYAPDTQYCTAIRLYIAQGGVKIKADIGEDESPEVVVYEKDLNAFGWVTLIVDAWDLGSAETDFKQVTIKITSLKANTTFYLDSICEHRGARFLGFTELHTADELKTKADLLVETNRVPSYLYSVDFTDLFARDGVDKVMYDSAQYAAGGLVNIDDEELGITKKLRISQIQQDLLNPTRGSMQCEEDGTKFESPLTKAIGQIRVSQVANSGARGL